jgi:hypothetical protein
LAFDLINFNALQLEKMNCPDTYVVKVQTDDLDAEERFVSLIYDSEARRIVSMSPELTEAEMREDLIESGSTDHEIDAELDKARKAPGSATPLGSQTR